LWFFISGGSGGTGGRGRYCKRKTSWGAKWNTDYCGDNGAGSRASDGPRGYTGESGSSKAMPTGFTVAQNV